MLILNQNGSTEGETFALHAANLSSIPGLPYGPLNTVRSNS